MMSAFEIRIKKKALKFISDLGSKEKVKLRDAFIKLKENPVPVNSNSSFTPELPYNL